MGFHIKSLVRMTFERNIYIFIGMNCSVSHGENDTNICELQHVWNVHPALLWIAPWNFLPLSWSPPTQTSGDFPANRVRSQSTRSNPRFCCFNPHVWCFHISHGQISVSQTYISQKIGVETSIFHGQIPRGSGFQGEIPLYATRLGLPGRTHWLRRRRDGWHGQTPALGSSVPGPGRSIRSSTGDFTIKTWHWGHQRNYKWENAYLNAYSYIIRWFINGKII